MAEWLERSPLTLRARLLCGIFQKPCQEMGSRVSSDKIIGVVPHLSYAIAVPLQPFSKWPLAKRQLLPMRKDNKKSWFTSRRTGRIFSSKCSIAIEEISRSSIRASCERGGLTACLT